MVKIKIEEKAETMNHEKKSHGDAENLVKAAIAVIVKIVVEKIPEIKIIKIRYTNLFLACCILLLGILILSGNSVGVIGMSNLFCGIFLGLLDVVELVIGISILESPG